MKICIVVDNLDPFAGWGRLASNIARQFEIQGHQVGFIINGHPSLDKSTLSIPFKNGSRFLKSVLEMRNCFKEYDIVLCYDAFPYGFYSALALLGLQKKFVLCMVGTYSLFSGNILKNLFIHLTYRRANYIIAISDFIFKKVAESIKLGKYEIVPVGVDVNLFQHSDSPSTLVEAPYIITVGAIKARKGYHNSIRAFLKIATEFPELKYVIVGRVESRSYFAGLKKMISDHQCDSRVIFLSDISDHELVKLYSSARAFILTSITTRKAVEGYGIVYLEAGACGLPVIGSMRTGADDAIDEGQTGFLVNDKVEDISGALIRLLRNENLAVEIGKNGIKKAQELSWGNITNKYLEIFNKL